MAHPAQHLLLVEDDEDTRELYVEAFESAGYVVRSAASNAEARAHIAEAQPDVLVADYTLSDGTGTALLALCAAARPRLCVLVTGFTADQLPEHGFDVVLTKPFGVAALLEAVRGKPIAG